MVEQDMFTYSPLEKQIKNSWGLRQKAYKAIEQLVESSVLINIPLVEQTKYLICLLKKKSFEFRNLEKVINSDNLIYKCKTEGKRFYKLSKIDRII